MAGNQEKGDVPEWTKALKLKDPHLDMDFLLNPKNLEKIKENITNRKGVGDMVSQKGKGRVMELPCPTWPIWSHFSQEKFIFTSVLGQV